VTRRIPLLLIAIGLLGGLVSGPAGAQDDPITLTAEVGYDGHYRQDEWVPVRVTVANSGSDVEGSIVLEQTGSSPGEIIRYQLPVVLPGQSRKAVTLYAGIDQYRSRITVKLVSGGRTLAQTTVPVKQVSDTAHLIAIASGEPVDMDFLKEAAPTDETTYLAYITLDQLPAVGPAWDGLDVLILNDVDTGTLSAAQLSALRGWLAAGGHLIVTGGPNWLKTSAGLSDLLPVEVIGSTSLYDLESLSRLAQREIEGGPFVVAQGERRSGRTLIAQDDLPLLVRRDEGLGQVDWLALDLALAPLRDWAGNVQLWEILLADSIGRALWDDENINIWAAQEGLSAIPSLALPSALQMVAFLLVYTLVIGPVNYLVLKRLNRRELAWLTIPAMVLLFSGLAYITGFQIKGGAVIFSRLSLVYGAAGSDTARARGLVGVFSPNRATYDVTLPAGVLVRPLTSDQYSGGLGSDSSATIEQGEMTILRDVKIDVARIRAFRTELDVPAPTIGADLVIDTSGAPRLTGRVTNRGDIDLQDTGLWIGSNVFELGDLAPGQSVPVNERLSGGQASQLGSSVAVGVAPYTSLALPYPGNQMDKLVGGSNYWSDDVLNRRYQTLQAFLFDQGVLNVHPQRVIFFAWSEGSMWEIGVGEQESSTLDTVGYFLELPLNAATTEGRIVIPPALTTWQPLDGGRQGEAGPYGYYLLSGWVSFQYQPWEAFQMAQVDELALHLGTSYQQGRVRVALWDWARETWVVDESIGWGNNTIRDPARFVGPNNAVRVRAENTTTTGYTIDMDVTFRGTAE
jgi:hypothetical protein